MHCAAHVPIRALTSLCPLANVTAPFIANRDLAAPPVQLLAPSCLWPGRFHDPGAHATAPELRAGCGGGIPPMQQLGQQSCIDSLNNSTVPPLVCLVRAWSAVGSRCKPTPWLPLPAPFPHPAVVVRANIDRSLRTSSNTVPARGPAGCWCCRLWMCRLLRARRTCCRRVQLPVGAALGLRTMVPSCELLDAARPRRGALS